MSNLIPTPRTDKNGRTVTRYMKPDAISTKRTKALPPVTLDERGDLISAIVQILSETQEAYLPGSYGEETNSRTLKALNTYSPATLRRIKDHDWGFDSKLQLISGITNQQWDEITVNDYLAADLALKGEEPMGIPTLHVSSWSLYHELHPVDTNSDYPQERLNQIVALYTITEHMDAQGGSPYHRDQTTNQIDSYYLEPSPLRDLIFNPGDNHTCEDIVRIITTHNTYDPERIKAMLDLGNSSLSSGVL